MRQFAILSLMLLLSACAGAANTTNNTPVPTIPVLVGQADILTPATGSIIYSETLTISGTANDLPPEGFTVRVITAQDDLLAETTLRTADLDAGRWSLQIAHGYVGQPTEISVLAAAANPVIPGRYDVSSVLLLPLSERPEGVFGSIRFPASDAVVGGDSIQVEGTLSGVADGRFTLALYERAGDLISEQPVVLDGYTALDEGVWTATVQTNSYVGPAVLRMTTPQQGTNGGETPLMLDELALMLSLAAG